MMKLFTDGGVLLVVLAVLCAWAWYRSLSLWFALRGAGRTARSGPGLAAPELAAPDLVADVGTPNLADPCLEDLRHHAARRQWRRPLPIIATLAGLAPLLGLLGTVVGIMETFDALAESSGAAMASRMAAGISRALVTTQAGLVTALPLLFVHRALARRLAAASSSSRCAFPWRYRRRHGIP